MQFRGAKLRKKECNAKEKPDFLLTLPRRSNFGKAKVTKKNNGNMAEALMPLVDSMNRTSRNLCVLRDVLKIISDRQKKDKEVIDFVASLVEELLATIKQEVQASANKDNGSLSDEVHKLKHDILEQLSKPQHRKVTHDLTTNTWWLVGVGTILFFCMFLLTSKIYDQSKEIDRLELSDWKYRALRATLPSNNVNVIWLERNVWRGNDDGIRRCQQFVIRSTSDRLARPRTMRILFAVVMRWNNK